MNSEMIFDGFLLNNIFHQISSSPEIMGILGFTIPAFLWQFLPEFLLKYSDGSKSTLVIAETKGFIILVESNLPPKPTSIMAKSTFFDRNIQMP